MQAVGGDCFIIHLSEVLQRDLMTNCLGRTFKLYTIKSDLCFLKISTIENEKKQKDEQEIEMEIFLLILFHFFIMTTNGCLYILKFYNQNAIMSNLISML